MGRGSSPDFESKRLSEEYDALAPDGSEIRLLLRMKRGSMAHCTLQPDAISRAVRHRTMEEIWYFAEGRGEVWRKQRNREETVPVSPGFCISIPTGTHFQFRCTGNKPLRFVIVTMPPWPGEDEAIRVKGKWQENI